MTRTTKPQAAKPKRRRFDLADLPTLAAIFQAVQFAHAGSVFFGPFGWVIGGIGGSIANLAVSAAASRLADVPDKRKRLTNILFLLLMAISPAAIAPAAYIEIREQTVLPPGIQIMSAIVWAMLPDLGVGLVGAIVGKGLFSLTTSAPTANVPSGGGGQGGKPSRKRPAKALANFTCKYAANGCTMTKPTQNAINAHAAKCQFKPIQVSIPQGANKP